MKYNSRSLLAAEIKAALNVERARRKEWIETSSEPYIPGGVGTAMALYRELYDGWDLWTNGITGKAIQQQRLLRRLDAAGLKKGSEPLRVFDAMKAWRHNPTRAREIVTQCLEKARVIRDGIQGGAHLYWTRFVELTESFLRGEIRTVPIRIQ